MLHPFEIIHGVLDANRSLAIKLARITGKADTYFRAQGYEPKTSNPLMSGVNSPVADYMAYCELYEAAQPSCGRMLSDRVHSELSARFTEADLTTTQKDLHVNIEKETCDVRVWLASFDIDNSTSRKDLAAFEEECKEAISALMQAQSKARARKIQLSVSSNGVAV